MTKFSFCPSFISLVVSVDVKQHVYLLYDENHTRIVTMLPAAILNVPGEHPTQETPLSQLLLMHSET